MRLTEFAECVGETQNIKVYSETSGSKQSGRRRCSNKEIKIKFRIRERERDDGDVD
jgi:hypothetical protein